MCFLKKVLTFLDQNSQSLLKHHAGPSENEPVTSLKKVNKNYYFGTNCKPSKFSEQKTTTHKTDIL